MEQVLFLDINVKFVLKYLIQVIPMRYLIMEAVQIQLHVHIIQTLIPVQKTVNVIHLNLMSIHLMEVAMSKAIALQDTGETRQIIAVKTALY